MRADLFKKSPSITLKVDVDQVRQADPDVAINQIFSSPAVGELPVFQAGDHRFTSQGGIFGIWRKFTDDVLPTFESAAK